MVLVFDKIETKYIKYVLTQNKELSEQLLTFDAFTDIVFNPKKSINCQTRSAAIYVSLVNSKQ